MKGTTVEHDRRGSHTRGGDDRTSCWRREQRCHTGYGGIIRPYPWWPHSQDRRWLSHADSRKASAATDAYSSPEGKRGSSRWNTKSNCEPGVESLETCDGKRHAGSKSSTIEKVAGHEVNNIAPICGGDTGHRERQGNETAVKGSTTVENSWCWLASVKRFLNCSCMGCRASGRGGVMGTKPSPQLVRAWDIDEMGG